MAGPVPSIGYEDVRAAARALEARGERVSRITVRAQIGRGSYSTLGPLVERWHEERRAQGASAALTALVPDHVRAALLGWVAKERDRASAEATVEAAVQMAETRRDLMAAEEEGRRLAAELAEAIESLAEARREATGLAARLSALQTERTTLEQDRVSVAERAAAAEAREAAATDARKQAEAVLTRTEEALREERAAHRQTQMRLYAELEAQRLVAPPAPAAASVEPNPDVDPQPPHRRKGQGRRKSDAEKDLPAAPKRAPGRPKGSGKAKVEVETRGGAQNQDTTLSLFGPIPLDAEPPLQEWAEGVLSAARTIPPRQRFGQDRALVSRVYTTWAQAGGTLDLDTFKARLVEANRARFVSLVCADMAPVMVAEGHCTQQEIQDSECHQLTAVFHLLCL